MNLKRIFNRLIDNESLRTDTTPTMTAQEPQKPETTNTMSHDQPMTPEEAIQECIKIDPERSYNAEYSQWYHHDYGRKNKPKLMPVNISIFVSPGVNDYFGERYIGNSFESAITAFKAVLDARNGCHHQR